MREETGSPDGYYGKATVSLVIWLAQFDEGLPEMLAVPVSQDVESQNRSTALPLPHLPSCIFKLQGTACYAARMYT